MHKLVLHMYVSTGQREEQTDKVNALADALEAVTASRDEALVKAAKAVEDLKKRKSKWGDLQYWRSQWQYCATDQEAMVLESFRDLERDLSLVRAVFANSRVISSQHRYRIASFALTPGRNACCEWCQACSSVASMQHSRRGRHA